MSFTQEQVDFLDANRGFICARRTFEVGFQSGTVRLIEGSTLWNDGVNTFSPAHTIIQPENVVQNSEGIMNADPASYRVGAVSEELGAAHLTNEAEWREAVVHQRVVLFSNGVAVGPAIHIDRGRISDIRRHESVEEDYFTILVEGPFRDRNQTSLGRYTDRDQQMRSPGDRGCEYASQYETSGAEFKGWLNG